LTKNADKELRIKMLTWKATRTSRANRLFHLLVDKLAKFHGEDRAKVKLDLKYAFGVKEEYQPGIWYFKSTSGYTWDEFSFLLDMTFQELAELGIDARQEYIEYKGLK